jgi:hypothetical protein
MIAIEKCPRREGFSEGVRFLGADGAVWHLPILDEAAWDRFPEIGDFIASCRIWEGGENPDRKFSDSIGPMIALVLSLIRSNYYVADGDLAGLIIHVYGGGIAFGAQAAFFEAVKTPIIQALACAEFHGLDRKLARASLLVHFLGGKPPIGWGAHDSVLFDN